MTWRVILGTVSIMISMIVFGYVAVTEPDRMASFEKAYTARQVELGATLYFTHCLRCHGLRGEGGIGPALNAADLFNGERLGAIKWVGGTEAFLRGTITSGRPRATVAFPNAAERMPAWGDSYGGPLRRDQIESLVTFIMNWGEAYKDASGKYIASATPTPNPNAVGTDINVQLPAGDAANGAKLVETRVCTACHVVGAGTTAPAWEAAKAADGKSVAQNAAERYQSAGYTGKAASPEQYLLESIIQPSAYLVPGQATWSNNGTSTMLANLSEVLTKQEAADIIAYLLTIK